jgi:N-acetylated-alpha-linked acidic dipeptidase
MSVAPYLNFAPLDNALVALEQSAKAYASASAKLASLPADKLKELNEILYKTERKLIHEDGLPSTALVSASDLCPGVLYGVWV